MISFTPGTCLFENRRDLGANALVYQNPISLIETHALHEVPSCLAAVDQALDRGLHVAGYISYEAGYAWESGLATPPPPHDEKLPLLRFWLYEARTQLEARAIDEEILQTRRGGHILSNLIGDLTKPDYMDRVDEILELIRAGDIYQTNFTFPLRGQLSGDALSLYAALRVSQPVAYGAFLRMEEADILSHSPELFVTRKGDQLFTRPMKGTAARGRTDNEDAAARKALRADPKERAENLMIVDLLRNDLSRICETGTVSVPNLFEVETYPSLHTMVSDVTGRIVEGTKISDVIKAMFPCGSVTGAPKIRAMEVIRGLESSPRGPYTGSIGYMSPNGDFQFNVAIRTLTAYADGTITYPIGGGIVADSTPQKEYEECLLKSRILKDEFIPFDLIETIGWSAEEGFSFLDLHMQRLRKSAEFYDRPFDHETTLAALEQAVSPCSHGEHYKVRLTLDPGGAIQTTVSALESSVKVIPLRFALSATQIDSANPKLRHKTSQRAVYTEEFARQKNKTGCGEVLFFNQHGELTEGTWTNLFVEKNGQLLTPPVSSGLLPGVLREHLLAKDLAQEAVLFREDLEAADKIYLGNSVRGLMPAKLVRP